MPLPACACLCRSLQSTLLLLHYPQPNHPSTSSTLFLPLPLPLWGEYSDARLVVSRSTKKFAIRLRGLVVVLGTNKQLPVPPWRLECWERSLHPPVGQFLRLLCAGKVSLEGRRRKESSRTDEFLGEITLTTSNDAGDLFSALLRIFLSLSLFFLFLHLRRLVLHFFSSFYACSNESKVKKEREEDRWNRAEMKSNRRKIESLSIETWHSITSGENFLLITMGTYLCLLCSIMRGNGWLRSN